MILSIETSADETAAAVTEGRRVLSNVIYSQILMHRKWGGIYPSLAKRAHEEKIDQVVEDTLNKFQYPNPNFQNQKNKKGTEKKPYNKIIEGIDYIAVTYGPGLAIALEVGIKKAKELASNFNKKLVAVNHLEGHIYSCFVQNGKGNPEREFKFPYLALILSGGHTEILLFKNHLEYKILGETRDDAAGEALDKAAKLLGLGYPGGPVIERLAAETENKDFFKFPRPMMKSKNLDFSFSGLKTAFFYFLNSKQVNPDGNLKELASSFQNAVFDTILHKTWTAMKQTGINRLVIGGGVSANLYLRKLLRNLVKESKGEVYFPSFKYLTGDNAAMIGVVANYKIEKGIFVKDMDKLDRIPRLSL